MTSPALTAPPDLTPSDLCFVCDKPALDGDEPGWTFMDNGVPVPNCSMLCCDLFYDDPALDD